MSNTAPPKKLTTEEIATFDKDGVVLIRNAVAPLWLERLNDIVERIVSRPSQWISDTGDQGEGRGRALDERYLWRDSEDVRSFLFDSGVASLVGQAMRAQALRLYFDHWFVKEPGTLTETPWHQDAVAGLSVLATGYGGSSGETVAASLRAISASICARSPWASTPSVRH